MATTETPQEALTRIQSQGFGKNDALVIQTFADRGIPAEAIDPRNNVLTFNAWKAKSRVVAKGAISVRAITWIPCKEKGTDKKSLRPKTVFLFHESQTNPKDAPKGTAPSAVSNHALIREGTYETTQIVHVPPVPCNCPAVGLVTNVNCPIHGEVVKS